MSDHEHDKEQHVRVPDAASQQTGERAVEHAATKTKRVLNRTLSHQNNQLIRRYRQTGWSLLGVQEISYCPLHRRPQNLRIGLRVKMKVPSTDAHRQNDGDETQSLSDEGKRRGDRNHATPGSSMKSSSDGEE